MFQMIYKPNFVSGLQPDDESELSIFTHRAMPYAELSEPFRLYLTEENPL